MRTIIILCLALLVALSFGCSKKKEEAPKTESVQEDMSKAGTMSPTFDMVTREEVDITTAAYSYEYNGVIYYFTSAENMEAFKADPVKYLTPPPAPGTTPQGQ
jgi:YHS domain-containing protein